jgi:heme exporter protein CcmD
MRSCDAEPGGLQSRWRPWANPRLLACRLPKRHPEQIMVQHGGVIMAAFLVTGTVLAGMIAAVLIDHRAQLRTLRRLLPEHSDRRGCV